MERHLINVLSVEGNQLFSSPSLQNLLESFLPTFLKGTLLFLTGRNCSPSYTAKNLAGGRRGGDIRGEMEMRLGPGAPEELGSGNERFRTVTAHRAGPAWLRC